MKGKKQFQPLKSTDICRIYNRLHEKGIVSFSLNPDAEFKIDSVVGNILGSNFGVENYPTHYEKVVAYLWFVTKAHAFIDGNKRTAVTSFLVICDMNDIQVNEEWESLLDNLVVWIEQYKKSDYQEMIKKFSLTLFV